jgi:hypothetical protein
MHLHFIFIMKIVNFLNLLSCVHVKNYLFFPSILHYLHLIYIHCMYERDFKVVMCYVMKHMVVCIHQMDIKCTID